MRFTKRSLMIAPLALVFVVACNDGAMDDDIDNGIDDPAVTTNDVGISIATVDVGRTLSGDNIVADFTDTFNPSDTVYVAVNTVGSGTATLSVKWTYQDGQVVGETSRTVTTTGAENTEFHVSKPDGLPVGDYKVAVMLNGQEVQTDDFKVEADTP